MKFKLLAATAAGALALAMAGSAAALETVTVNGYTLDDTTFGAQFGVHFDNASNDVFSAVATVNQDGSDVTFSSTDAFDTDTGGEAVVSDGSGANADPFDNLHVVFENSWDKVTFSFDGGTDSLMRLIVNGTTTFTAFSDPVANCDFCVIKNGETKFTISGSATPISTLDFYFAPDIGSGRQFRVMDVANATVPEPATWGLMILGFGGIGALMRRRRAQLAFA